MSTFSVVCPNCKHQFSYAIDEPIFTKELELEIEQKVKARLTDIQIGAQRKADELYKLQLAQKDKQIKDIELQLSSARRTAEQASQQAQGEIAEIEFEKELRIKYPQDQFEAVPKGFEGADLIQTIVNTAGRKIGSIIWEFKNTKSFSYDWIGKLKKDQQQVNADIAILVSKTLPKNAEAIEMQDGILIVTFELALPLSKIIRKSINDLAYSQLAVQGQNEKMQLIYNYLTGNQFKTKIQAIITAFQTLKDEIETEKRAYKRIWAAREKMLEQIIDSTCALYGEIEGIAGTSVPKIEELDLLQLN